MESTIPVSPPRPLPTEVIACLEMEMDHSEDYEEERHLFPATRNTTSGSLVGLAQNLVTYMNLWIQLHPRVGLAIGGCILLLMTLSVWNSVAVATSSSVDMTRHHLDNDYTKLTADYDLRKANIHHWCLFGGNDNCYCEDPTAEDGASREEVVGWRESHARNQRSIDENPVVQRGGVLDVVFVGAEIFQAWGEGQFLERNFREGIPIAALFNQTFRSEQAELQGLALGIYTDRCTNLLWRLHHGEMPAKLKAKVWWILIGADDLALAMCSEDVVILGILKVAEEIAFHNPNAKVVIQGLLPRSNHKDGSLHITDEKKKSTFRHNSKDPPFDKNNIWAYRTDQLDPKHLDPGHSTTSSALQQAADQARQPYFDYYIWPSILEINKELQGFCNRADSDQFEYFDADGLFVESVGTEQRIKADLMPNSIFLSLQGHKVLMDAIKGKLKELLKNPEP